MFGVLVAACALLPPQSPAPTEGGPTRPDYEQLLVDHIRPAAAGRHLRALTEDPHMAGTPADRRTADYVRGVLDEAGFETEIAEYHVLLSYPRRVAVTVTRPTRIELDLLERSNPLDKDSHDLGAVEPFNAYAASGTAEASVVYAHYGRDEDFDWLDSQGISVEGKICLIRYGKTFRGLKVFEAQERGAKGVLLYDDPDDDGYRRGDVYPEGPWRPASAVQRGSLMFLSQHCGDPLTPGQPALLDAKRLSRAECRWLPSIPCLPISSENAAVLLSPLRGRNVPAAWQGGCPVTYHTGPGPTTVRLEVELDEAVRPIWNVIGRLRAPSTSDRYVLVGNHRDSWVHGASDPNSGTAVSLEAMRSLGELVRRGWEPRLEIRYASWDAEEFGLIGSTEWGEHHAADIQAKCLAYFNCDAAVSGTRFGASATPDLVQMMARAAARTEAHDGQGNLLTRWAHGSERPPVGNLGSGSDYTVFLCHLGIPCLDFGSRGGHGVYHSLFDNTYTMERHLDPGYLVHAAMARFLALATYDFAGAPVPPLDVTAIPHHLETSVKSLHALGAEHRASLLAALEELQAAAEKGAEEDQMIALHSAFLHEDGVLSRPWYRNLTVAPHLDLGYGAAVLPGVAEALAAEDDGAVDFEVARLLRCIANATAILAM